MEKVNYEFIEECKKELAEIKELMKIYKELYCKYIKNTKNQMYVGKITPEYDFWKDFLGLFGYKCEDKDEENSDNSRTYLKDGSYIRTYDVYYQSNDPDNPDEYINPFKNPDYIICQYQFFKNN